MAETKTRTATSGMSKEEEILAYSAIAVLIAAIGFVVGAIFMGASSGAPLFCRLGHRATPTKKKAPGEGGTGENRLPGLSGALNGAPPDQWTVWPVLIGIRLA